MRSLGLALATALALVLILSSTNIEACFDPTDAFSGEVLLNKPGVSYNWSILGNIPYVAKVSNITYVYRSHVGNAIVILYLDETLDGIPILGPNNSNIEYYPGVRIEFPWLKLDNVNNITKAKENATTLLKEILGYELKWLIRIHVISGITQDDIDNMVSEVKAGYAGWNSRLVYYKGDSSWHPYYELVTKGLINGELLKSIGCRWEIPQNIVPKRVPDYDIANTTTIPPINNIGDTLSPPANTQDTTYTNNTETKEDNYHDGRYLMAALIIGSIASVATLYIISRIK